LIDGEKLRSLLKAKGVSVMNLARRLGWTGAPTYLYNLMNGKHEATQEFLERVSEALEVPPVLLVKDELLRLLGADKDLGKVAEGHDIYSFRMASLPIVGYVSAGEPSVPDYSNGDTPPSVGVLGEIDLQAETGANCYAVRIKGDSMLPRFRDGNIVICSPEAPWRHGDTCLIRHLDGRIWIKRLIDHEGTWCLEPDNPLYESIPLRRDEIAYAHRVVLALIK